MATTTTRRRADDVQLDDAERLKLAELEAVLERGLETAIEVANALGEIHGRRLYRVTHTTFEDYCRDLWGIRRSRAYQLLDYARVSTVVDKAGLPPLANESQTRALAPVLRREGGEQLVLDLMSGLAEKGLRPTARLIRDRSRRQSGSVTARARDARLASSGTTRVAHVRECLDEVAELIRTAHPDDRAAFAAARDELRATVAGIDALLVDMQAPAVDAA